MSRDRRGGEGAGGGGLECADGYHGAASSTEGEDGLGFKDDVPLVAKIHM